MELTSLAITYGYQLADQGAILTPKIPCMLEAMKWHPTPAALICFMPCIRHQQSCWTPLVGERTNLCIIPEMKILFSFNTIPHSCRFPKFCSSLNHRTQQNGNHRVCLCHWWR